MTQNSGTGVPPLTTLALGPTTQISPETLRSVIDEHFDTVLAHLTRLVAIESIAWPEYARANVISSAQAVADLATSLGFDSVEVLTAPTASGEPGYPAVVARKAAPAGTPTVVLYAHHDVQPTGDGTLWNTPPFEATRQGDRMFGRGVADDKAGIMVHMSAVALLGEQLGVGVVLFIEGEEEAGSPSFANFLRTYRDKLAGDVIVVADSGNWAPGVPALTTSLRGMVALDVTVRTLDHALHSGIYGGVVPDAGLAMIRMLNSLYDTDGSVAIEGLVRHDIEGVDYTEATVRADSGVLDSTELIGSGSMTSRLWASPSVTVIGLDLPHVAHASNTLQAAVRARISMRLAPGQDPGEALAALKNHLGANVPFGATLEFGDHEAGSPWQAQGDDPVVATAKQALSDGFGAEVVEMGLGGSIPFIADLTEVYPEASILVTGVEDPDTRAHSANESLYLPDFAKAIVSEALLLHRLGQGDQGQHRPADA